MKALPKNEIKLMLTQWGGRTENGYRRMSKTQRRNFQDRVIKAHIYSGWYFPNGVPVKYLMTDESMMDWICDNLPVVEEAEYSVQAYSKKRTPTGVGFSTTKLRFKIHDRTEHKYEYWDSYRMGSFWFRKRTPGKR